MEALHDMRCEAETATEALFVCPVEACGRRIVVGKTRPAFTVIDRGDFHARHSGSLGGLVMAGVSVTP
jgi:hypothetical protein